MDNKIQEIKKIIINLTKDFHYNENQINFLTLAYLGIVMLDPNISDMLEEVLRKTYICFSNANKYTEDISSFFPDLSKDTLSSLSTTAGLALNKQIINNKISEHPIIFIKCDQVILKTIDTLIHELKHLINEVVSPANDDYGLTYFYSGLAKRYEYTKYFSMIDEAFNCYITKLYLSNIGSLKSLSINDVGIQEILEKWDLKIHKYPPQYDIVKYCIPLFESPELFRLFYNATIYKDNGPLYASLNNILSPYTYKDFFDALDEKNEEKIENILKSINYQKLNNSSNKTRN